MTTLKDYLRDLVIDSYNIGKQFVPGEKSVKDIEDELDELVEECIDNIKSRLIDN